MSTLLFARARTRALAVALLTLVLFASGCSSDADDTASDTDTTEATQTTDETDTADGPAAVELPEGAAFEQYELDGVTVHAYLGITALNGNYVIESENSVVVVDTSFQDPDPATLRALADATGKPIERVLITHGHPDDVGGLNDEFADVPVATTATVAGRIDAGDREIEILDGPFTIDGVEYVATEYLDAEDTSQMVVEMVGRDAVFSGDLVYNGVHAFLTEDLENWISIIDELAADEPALVFPGHGPVGDATAYADTRAYLETAIEVLPTVSTVDEFEVAMLEAYPDRLGAFFIRFYGEGLVAARGGG